MKGGEADIERTSNCRGHCNQEAEVLQDSNQEQRGSYASVTKAGVTTADDSQPFNVLGLGRLQKMMAIFSPID